MSRDAVFTHQVRKAARTERTNYERVGRRRRRCARVSARCVCGASSAVFLTSAGMRRPLAPLDLMCGSLFGSPLHCPRDSGRGTIQMAAAAAAARARVRNGRPHSAVHCSVAGCRARYLRPVLRWGSRGSRPIEGVSVQIYLVSSRTRCVGARGW